MAKNPPQEVVLTPEQRYRKVVIPFYTAIAANANITLVSSKITHMYKITKVEVHFRDDTAHNLQVRVVSSTNRNAPTANPPTGTNIIDRFSNTPYVVGQGETIVLDCQYIPTFREVYVKVYISNLNAYALTSMVLVTIQSITIEEAEELMEKQLFEWAERTPESYFKELDGRGRALWDQVIDYLQGTPTWIDYDKLEPLVKTHTKAKIIELGGVRLSQPFNFIETGWSDEEKVEAFKEWWKECDNLVLQYHASNLGLELVTLGQLDAQRDWIETDKQIWQVIASMGKVSRLAFDKAWYPALERITNQTWLPNRPDAQTFVDAVIKGNLSDEEYDHWMRYEGYNPYWSTLMRVTQYKTPDYSELREAVWRGFIKREHIGKHFKYAGLDPRYHQAVWGGLLDLIPPYTDLINMRVKEKITEEEFIKYLGMQGYQKKWADLIWDAHFVPPNATDFMRYYWRGKITKEELMAYLKLVDYDIDTFGFVWEELTTEIPPYSELVNERVKEVLTEEEFYRYIQYYGFDPIWAGRIWDAHFTPASFADFLTAMRRKKTVLIPVAGKPPIPHTFGIDVAEDIRVIKDLSILADYDPRYWDFFETRMYNDPTPRMARWAFEVGALTEEDVAEVVHRFGYRPEDEKWFTNMLVGFQERGWVTKYLTACATAYIKGVITPEELKRRVVEVANRNEAVAEWIVRIADVRKEMVVPGVAKPKLLGIGDLKKAFLRDKIDEDVLRRELMLRGYETGDIDILISLLIDEKTVEEAGGRMVALTINQQLQAWRFGVIEEDYLRTQLLLRGLSLEEVEQLIETKKRQWFVGGQT